MGCSDRYDRYDDGPKSEKLTIAKLTFTFETPELPQPLDHAQRNLPDVKRVIDYLKMQMLVLDHLYNSNRGMFSPVFVVKASADILGQNEKS